MHLALYTVVAALAAAGSVAPEGRPASEAAGVENAGRLNPELQRESAVFLQRRLGAWKLRQATAVLGEPQRRRDGYDDGVVTGDIYAFPDPTRRYRLFELLFDRGSGALRTVFIYPWKMTWKECVELWGEDAGSTRNPDGTEFRAYRTRNLDVLLEADGAVISLGVY